MDRKESALGRRRAINCFAESGELGKERRDAGKKEGNEGTAVSRSSKGWRRFCKVYNSVNKRNSIIAVKRNEQYQYTIKGKRYESLYLSVFVFGWFRSDFP